MTAIKRLADGAKARIILSKPPLNIFDINDLYELCRTFKTLAADPQIKLITLESDQKVFSAGVDISDHSADKAKQMLEAFHSVFFEMLELEIPVISLVKSGCIGGGCELALFCDFVLASDSAYFSQPEIKVGCFPPISMVYFPYITSSKRALEMILTGNKVSAQDALNYGLVNAVFTEDNFNEGTEDFINSILSGRQDIIKTTLRAYKQLNYAELKEKIKLCEKIYLEQIDHDTISLKK